MAKQFENPKEEELDRKTVVDSDKQEEERIERVAEKAAQKSGKAEQDYDSANPIISR